MAYKKESTKLIYEGPVEELRLEPYYDHHGDFIWLREEFKTLTHKNIKLQFHTYNSKLLKRRVKEINLYIDGEEYREMEIDSIHGTPKKLIIQGVMGAG